MSDDWRLHIAFDEQGYAGRLVERLDASELEQRLERSFPDRVIVSREGTEVFCYAGTREQAEMAEQLAQSVAAEHGWQLQTELRRWHPSAEAWEKPDVPLPESDAQLAAEHAERIAREREQPYPEFEVRVECSSREAAAELAERLRAEGLPSVQRFRFVLVGAADEDSAAAFAERLRAEAPAGSTVSTEGTVASVLSSVGGNPFAVFGGMGG